MKIFIALLSLVLVAGCKGDSAESRDKKSVARQQSQYAAVQPIPAYDWSLERDLVIQLYNTRNMKAATHSVWRSDRGLIEGDCPSIGFGIPYDTSLTNPLKAVGSRVKALTSIEQPEPNGIFASKNTAATWIMCAGDSGQMEPHYIETKVTVYPYPVKVDYATSRVKKSGKASVTINSNN